MRQPAEMLVILLGIAAAAVHLQYSAEAIGQFVLFKNAVCLLRRGRVIAQNIYKTSRKHLAGSFDELRYGQGFFGEADLPFGSDAHKILLQLAIAIHLRAADAIRQGVVFTDTYSRHKSGSGKQGKLLEGTSSVHKTKNGKR